MGSLHRDVTKEDRVPHQHLLTALSMLSAAFIWVLLLAFWARRQPWVILGPLAAVIVFTPKSGPRPIITVSGISILPLDIILAVAVVSAVLEGTRARERARGYGVAASLLSALVAIQLVIGFSRYGTGALVEGRNYLALGIVIVYLLTLDEAVIRPSLIRHWLYVTASSLAALAILHMATQGFGSADTQVLAATGQEVTTRPLVAAQACVIAAAAIMAFHNWDQGYGTRYVYASTFFLLMVVLLQHRSVWVATAVGFASLVRQIRVSRVVLAALITTWLVAVIVMSAATTSLTAPLRRSLTSSFHSASLSSGTGGDRTGSAGVLLRQTFSSGPVHILLGTPFGSGFQRVVNGRLETYQPHDAYVQGIVRLGVIGLACAVIFLFLTLRRASGGDRAVVVLFVAFSLAYAFPFEMAPLLALPWLMRPVRNEGPPPEPEDGLATEGKARHVSLRI
jgi:hypothetical protein